MSDKHLDDYDRGYDDGHTDGASERDAELLELIDALWAYVEQVGDRAILKDDPDFKALEQRVRESRGAVCAGS